MPTPPQTVPLPERASLEQLKKRAKELQRAVRSEQPTALALVARHAPESRDPLVEFSLDTAQLVIARLHGFPSWPRLRQHLAARPGTPGDQPRSATRRVEDFYRLRTGWASAADVRRCAAAATPAHPDPADWQPLLTARRNGIRVIAFGSPDGVVFAELTLKRVTLSQPAVGASAGEGASVTFHTEFGTIAGVVAPEVGSLVVERPADRRPLGWTLVADGVFVAPNAFLVDSTGLVLRTNGSPKGEIVPVAALPARATAVVDRPAPAVEDPALATEDLTTVLAAADAPPIVDPEQWRPGAHADLTPHERVRLGRYGKLLVWHTTGDRASAEDPFVFDFTPQQGPVRDFAAVGKNIAATRMYYAFADGASGTIAVVGLVEDAHIASIVLRRDGMPDLAARITGGTFLIAGPDLTHLPERGPATAVLVARDHSGNVREELPYQEQD
ncbi:hypothetical protein ACFXKI_13605 [Streptomyces mirabilis]|uniref:hypothetical protein n=1 Tax=Streptomyces mirabilis TaxID=68239 RepID=UPI0036B08873